MYRNIAFVCFCAALPTLAAAQSAAQQGQEWQGEVIEEVVTLGTRTSRARSEQDSPVPVDLLSANDLRALGNTADITDSLKALVPSYTATTATGDGSAFVRPTSLRGMAPDQTLVLVNGKRRHRSALVHFFAPAAGNGAHGADIAMIPAIALKNVQVLRDGAAAQYGSDAIAGVINFALRDDSQGSQVRVQYGNFYEGEQSFSVAFNTGMVLAGDGFLNLSLESFGNDALSRGIQRADAQDLIDMGIDPASARTAPLTTAPLCRPGAARRPAACAPPGMPPYRWPAAANGTCTATMPTPMAASATSTDRPTIPSSPAMTRPTQWTRRRTRTANSAPDSPPTWTATRPTPA